MPYKPDWPESAARWGALWRGESLDRPCIVVLAPHDGGVPWPHPPADARDRYLSPAWVREHARAHLANTWWGGDAPPTYPSMAGWTVAHGARCRFAENTIWHDPIPFALDRAPAFAYRRDSADSVAVAQVQEALADLSEGDPFMVGQVIALPANDLVAAVLGSETVLTAMIDRPEWLETAIGQMSEAAIAQYRHLDREVVGGRGQMWYGVNWHPFWGPEPFLVAQSDISCMLSPEQFARFVLPDLSRIGAEYGRVWYHLDGPGALRHLPVLLKQDWLSVVQWVPGAGSEVPAEAWVDVLRAIQRAGKVATMAVEPQEVLPMLRCGLDPDRLVLVTGTRSRQEGEELVAAVTAQAHW